MENNKLTYHRISMILSLLLVSALFMTSNQNVQASFITTAKQSQTEAVNPGTIDQARSGFVDPEHGFVSLGSTLWWTSDGGSHWKDISPAELSGAVIEDIQFLNLLVGFVFTQNPLKAGYQLLKTSDGGLSWSVIPINLPLPVEESINIAASSLFFISEKTGWVSLKIATGINFSRGLLFKTVDGGFTWQELSMPLGEPVTFTDEFSGWISGGPAGDQLFHTMDGGSSWTEIQLPGFEKTPEVHIFTPHFFNELDGWMPVLKTSEDVNQLVVYMTGDGGETWDISASSFASAMTASIPLAYDPNGQKTFTFIDSDQLVVFDSQSFTTSSIGEPELKSVQRLFMFAGGQGFAETRTAECTMDAVATSTACTKTFNLWSTLDFGITWKMLTLPGGSLIEKSTSPLPETSGLQRSSSLAAQENTQIFIGQGFDKCNIPTLSQLQAWMNDSPYRSVNLYIGGSSRGCSNSGLTTSFVKQASEQGWTFIPTWVGLQAPCSAYSQRMSYNLGTAYQQGIDEAKAAVEQLFVLGLTDLNKMGSVVYYDIEAYPGGLTTDNNACRNAVKSFMDGWTLQLHRMGNSSGVYGSGCGSYIASYFAPLIANPPDWIWVAKYAQNYFYDPNASVWDMGSCVPSNVYTNHQRIHQYNGGHNETWGSVTMEIDSNVLDGVVAIPNTGSTPDCPATSALNAYVCTPVLNPVYNNNTCISRWYPFTGFNGLTAYLAENVTNSGQVSNTATWIPNLLQAGRYQVEAFIPAHGLFNQTCSWGTATYGNDSSSAKYVITDKNGSKSTITINQLPLNNEWTNLGIYEFGYGQGGSVTLDNATGESTASTNISASAVRFLMVEPNGDPILTAINPANVIVGTTSQILQVNGLNFTNSDVIQLNGVNQATTYVNPTQLTALLNATDMTQPAVKEVKVFSVANGNKSTAPAMLSVHTFTDVLPGAWYWKWVEGFFARGITTGCANSPLRYCPERVVTRAEAAVFLQRAKNGLATPVPAQTGIFKDVPVTGKEWMQPWIEKFYEDGITSGCFLNPLRFCAERNVTRAEMAVFVLRTRYGKDYVPPATTGIFSDVPVAGKEWMQPWIEQFYREGITTGCATGLYCPEQSVTRAELAVFLDRAFGFPQVP